LIDLISEVLPFGRLWYNEPDAISNALAKHSLYWFAFAIACVECLFIPFGTILGVFTIIVLSREPVKALFAATRISV
jgi:membrane protein YqaA with SNARE-associated domain